MTMSIKGNIIENWNMDKDWEQYIDDVEKDVLVAELEE